VPFLTVADHDLAGLGGAAVLAWVAGIMSVLAALVSGASSQARMLFDGGRSGLLPARLGRLRQPGDTPVNVLIVMTVAGLGIIGVWWTIHLVIGHTGSMDPVGLYAACSTMGTIVILVVYLLTNLSLPVFIWRRHRPMFSPIRHVAVPALGPAVLIVPFTELCEPGQPSPYSTFRSSPSGWSSPPPRSPGSPCTATHPPGRAKPPRHEAAGGRMSKPAPRLRPTAGSAT
jgi:amino acid transporter